MNSIYMAFQLVALTMLGFASAQTCSICGDNVVPFKSDVLLKFFPGTLPRTEYTCKELYFLGLYNDGSAITPEVCLSLVRLASFSCGCRGDDDDQDTTVTEAITTQVTDVSLTGSSDDFILSRPFVATEKVNSTRAFNTAATTSTTTSVSPSPKQFEVSDSPSLSPSVTTPTTMAPSSKQSEASDVPSTNPTTTRERATPSDSPKSMRPSTKSTESDRENPDRDEKQTDMNDEGAFNYHSELKEILQRLKNLVLRTSNDEKPKGLPTNYGKLRGM